MVEVINVIIMRVLGRNEFAKKGIIILYVIGGIIGLYWAQNSSEGGWSCPLVILRILHFLCFYGMGILYKKWEDYLQRIPNLIYFGIIFLGQVIVFLKYGEIPTYSRISSIGFTVV